MKNLDFDGVIENAKKHNSYLVAITIRDKKKSEATKTVGGKDTGDLTHFMFQQDFPIDDIIPSLDACVKSMNIWPDQPVPVVKPRKVYEKRKPLKIAILTHFNRCPDSYSPCKAVRSQIKLLMNYGHEVVFFTQEGSKVEVDCEMRPLVPKFRREKFVVNEEAKKKFIDVLREELTSDFDLAITHDFYIDDCITYREAIKECGVPIKWLHWARSGVGPRLDFKMDNARYVYMNYYEAGRFADRIGIKPEEVRVVFNDKDPALLFDWDSTTKMISDRMRLWEKDIVQTYPICTTRFAAKGINSVIQTFGRLKALDKRVALIICNANGRRRIDEIEDKLKYAEGLGLVRGDDIVVTSMLANEKHPIHSELPHKVVLELFRISNLFIFPTIAEVCPNILLEASMNKNLVVVNEDLPLLYDFVDKSAVLSYPFTSSKRLHYEGRENKDMDRLAKMIVGQVESNKADKQFRHTWRNHSIHTIYRNQLEPILYEDV